MSNLYSFCSEGRSAAAEVDEWLSNGVTRLPYDGGIKKRAFIPPSSSLSKTGQLVEAQS